MFFMVLLSMIFFCFGVILIKKLVIMICKMIWLRICCSIFLMVVRCLLLMIWVGLLKFVFNSNLRIIRIWFMVWWNIKLIVVRLCWWWVVLVMERLFVLIMFVLFLRMKDCYMWKVGRGGDGGLWGWLNFLVLLRGWLWWWVCSFNVVVVFVF